MKLDSEVTKYSIMVAEHAKCLMRITELLEAACDAHSAIATLEQSEFGYEDRDGQRWPIRDELLSKLQKAIQG